MIFFDYARIIIGWPLLKKICLSDFFYRAKHKKLSMVKTFTYVNAVSASIVLLVSNLSKILSHFIVLVVTARLLSPGELGIVTTAVLIITFLLILSELGLYQAVTQSIKMYQSIIFSAFYLPFPAAIFYSLLLVSSSSISLFLKN